MWTSWAWLLRVSRHHTHSALKSHGPQSWWTGLPGAQAVTEVLLACFCATLRSALHAAPVCKVPFSKVTSKGPVVFGNGLASKHPRVRSSTGPGTGSPAVGSSTLQGGHSALSQGRQVPQVGAKIAS